eukprot:gene19652-biopygen987
MGWTVCAAQVLCEGVCGVHGTRKLRNVCPRRPAGQAKYPHHIYPPTSLFCGRGTDSGSRGTLSAAGAHFLAVGVHLLCRTGRTGRAGPAGGLSGGPGLSKQPGSPPRR